MIRVISWDVEQHLAYRLSGLGDAVFVLEIFYRVGIRHGHLRRVVADVSVDLARHDVRLVDDDGHAQDLRGEHCRKTRIAAFAEYHVRIKEEYLE